MADTDWEFNWDRMLDVVTLLPPRYETDNEGNIKCFSCSMTTNSKTGECSFNEMEQGTIVTGSKKQAAWALLHLEGR